jgi:cutinase
MRPGRAFRAGLLTVAVLGASVSVEPQAVAAPECPDVEVIFARGTDEAEGIGQVGRAFVDTLKPMLKGRSIGTYAVEYPASFDFLEAAAGANDMSRRIKSRVADCPDTKLVLGGYSQGAAVVDIVATAPIAGFGYTEPLPRAVVPHVAAVVVFGNPSARLGQPLTRMSPDFGPKTADLCNKADPICSLGRDWNSHITYQKSGLIKTAAEWVAKLVKATDADSTGSS